MGWALERRGECRQANDRKEEGEKRREGDDSRAKG